MTTRTKSNETTWILREGGRTLTLGVGMIDGEALWTDLDPHEALHLGGLLVDHARRHLRPTRRASRKASLGR